ncbi:hypothetical protein CCAX7_56600 [Capsulimonas corticalis]|uniref:Uncharacterized protein n=1 Tax=Capsulimonas corticalis TaxID=2219043 RepID=A0A402D0G3_9BACT|nr:hypothetical protein [Capsulimonas corticalis]BDI33609.1 hypothetical protein CCAX7_56600 [Capsulimonas corticalis]
MPISRFHGYCALATTLAFTAHSARADDAKPKPITLAQALAQAAPPASELYIAVDPDSVTLPKDAEAPSPGDTAAQIATAFGRLVSGFGNVDAIAPPTIMVVNVPPDKPNIYDGMAPKQVVKLLAAGFTKDQWKEFLSDKGVGYEEMTSDNQRSLFEALFPDGKMQVQRADADWSAPATEIGGDQMRLARLRLAYRTSLALSVPGQKDSHVFASSYDPPDKLAVYFMMNSPSDSVDREFGANVRETVPNTLKPGDLDNGDAAWNVAVRLAGVKTVDDLVRAIAAATGREIYADPRYAKKAVTVVGPQTPARAWDVMRALALCLGAAWRQVGPAAVLTNDRIGLGVKHELWRQFEQKAAALMPGGNRGGAVTQPDGAAFSTKDIPFTNDAVPFSPKQQEAYWKKIADAGGMSFSGGMMQLTAPFAELTPEQQDAARHIQADNAKSHVSSTLDGDVMLQAEPMVQVTVPALASPVLVFQSYEQLLPDPAPLTEAAQDASQKRFEAQMQALTGPPEPSTAPAPAALLAQIRSFDRRAVLVEPHTPAEADTAIAAARTLGLNELWLRITPGQTDSEDAASLNLIKHAAKGAAAAHIAFYPDIRLLAWSAAPDALVDRTILDRTAMQVNEAGREALGHMVLPDVLNTVTPFDPEPARRLISLIGKAARVKGVAGMVWTDVTPHGYETEPRDQDGGGSDPLGYAIPGRLAALRAAHADPLDLHTTHYTDKRANVSVPGFGDDRAGDGALYDAWRLLRTTAEHGFQASLMTALPAAYAPGPTRRLLISTPEGENIYQQYGSWDDLTKPEPGTVFVPGVTADGKPFPDGSGTMAMKSATIYDSISLYVPEGSTADKAMRSAARNLTQRTQNKSRSIVFTAISDPQDLLLLASGVSAP